MVTKCLIKLTVTPAGVAQAVQKKRAMNAVRPCTIPFWFHYFFSPQACTGTTRFKQKANRLTKNGLYPAGDTEGTAPRGPAAGGSTGRPEEKMPRAFRFKPGIRFDCCCEEEEEEDCYITLTAHFNLIPSLFSRFYHGFYFPGSETLT